MPRRNACHSRTNHIGAPAIPNEKHLLCVLLRLMQELPEQLSAALLHTVGAGDKAAVKEGIAAAAQHGVNLCVRQIHI